MAKTSDAKQLRKVCCDLLHKFFCQSIGKEYGGSGNTPKQTFIIEKARAAAGLTAEADLPAVIHALGIKASFACKTKKTKPIPKKRSVPAKATTPTQKPFVCTDDFLKSDEWRTLRYKALELNGAACQCCGRSRKLHGVVLHVDHIKPRSKYPELAKDINNLQILCEDCNLGKSNKYSTDWRPVPFVEVETPVTATLPVPVMYPHLYVLRKKRPYDPRSATRTGLNN